ncbi:MAG TPA: hypothetical protein PKN32_06385 [Bacteroidales bacterium]|nr:hypothetical protein [Bacteroidales bacterium]
MKGMEHNLTQEQKEILSQLFSKDEKTVLNSIKIMRKKGGEFIVKPLLEIYFTTESESIRDAIYSLICDLKNNKTADIFVKNIELYANNDKLSKLLSAFWQSTIKFTDLLPFVKVFFSSNTYSAVEVLTIIEQNAYNISNENKLKCNELILSKISELEGFKHDVANEILEFLK